MQECLNKVLRVTARTPIQLLTGITPEGAVAHIACLGVDARVTGEVSAADIFARLDGLHKSMTEMWNDAVDSQRRRRRGRKSKRETLPVFNVGDTVLVAQAVRSSKLDMTWTGPHEVLRTVNPFVFETCPCVADQGKRTSQFVHVVRMRRFANTPLGTPADAVTIEKAVTHDFPDNIPQKLITHRCEAVGM